MASAGFNYPADVPSFVIIHTYMKKTLFFLFTLMSIFSFGQSTGYLRYDTVKIQKVGGNATLVIENSTRNVTGGVLTNIGGGRTAFVTPSGGGGGSEAGAGLLKTGDTLFVNQIDSLRLNILQLTSAIAAWGDSFTFGSPGTIGGYTSYLNAYTGRYVYNGGIAGQNSSAIRARMVADHAKHHWPTIIFIGRNDLPPVGSLAAARTQILTNAKTMVDTLIADGNEDYIVVSILNGGGEGVGTAPYDTIIAINTTLEALYPGHYAELREFMVSQYNPASPPDVANHTADIPPLSLRTDSFHYTNPGYHLMAKYLWDNHRFNLFDTSYSTMYVDANGTISLLKGAMADINVANAGSFSIGGQSIAWVPSRTILASGSLFYGNGGRSSTASATLNTAVGVDALLSNTDGNSNTAIGASVLRSNTTGSQSTAMGRFALFNNTTGSGTVIGYNAALAQTTATGTVAIGNGALQANAAGINNVAVGTIALTTCNGCAGNTSVGHSSQVLTTTATNNTSVGFESLRNNTTGINNAALGAVGGYFNTTGTGNVFVGPFSGWGNAGSGVLNYNTFLGFNTGRAIATGADSNVYIGANTVTTTAATGDRNIVIGNSLELPATSTSNYGSIGNVIFMRNGSFGSGVTPFGTGTTAGTNNVGLGINDPTERLDIDGQVRIRTVNAAAAGSVDSVAVMEDGRVKALVGFFAQGTYTPTLTGVTNIATSTAHVLGYYKFGSSVTVYGQVEFTATADADTPSQLDFSLPVASDFTTTGQCGGTGGGGMGATYQNNLYSFRSDATNNRVSMRFLAPTNGGDYVVNFSFTYQVL